MKKNTIFSIVRHLLSIGGGMIIANNPSHAVDIQNGLGAVTALAGLLWGAVDEHRAESAKQD